MEMVVVAVEVVIVRDMTKQLGMPVLVLCCLHNLLLTSTSPWMSHYYPAYPPHAIITEKENQGSLQSLTAVISASGVPDATHGDHLVRGLL